MLCRLAAAPDAQAVRIRVHTTRAGGGTTGNTRVTLAAVRGLGLGEDVMRDGSEIVVVLFDWRTAGPSNLDCYLFINPIIVLR